MQDYDGTLRITPGRPGGWDADGSVSIEHKGKAHVQVRNATLTTVAVEAGATGTVTVRIPWPGQNVPSSTASAPSCRLKRWAPAGRAELVAVELAGEGVGQALGDVIANRDGHRVPPSRCRAPTASCSPAGSPPTTGRTGRCIRS
ncbi:hypothetical protein ACIBF7_20360 [Nonomuraea sp. NPDC050478]|uniref:hypothetical protein n=1 Tax=Nonomuraea sp. NPDC050478 TaxID=3364365 RepID=UPI0037B799EA